MRWSHAPGGTQGGFAASTNTYFSHVPDFPLMRAALPCLGVVAFLLLPGASATQAEPAAAPVDLYAHVAGFPQFPLTTQMPPALSTGPVAVGSQTSGCLDVEGMSLAAHQRHTWLAFSHPASIMYETHDGQPRLMPQHGLPWDLPLSLEPMELEWHLETAPDAIVPDLVLLATLKSIDASFDPRKFDPAPLIAQGRSDPATLRPGMQHPQVTHHDVDGRDVYTFNLALDVVAEVAPATRGLSLRIDAFVDDPLCAGRDGYANPFTMGTHQSDGLWNRLRLHAHDVVRTQIHLQAMHDDLAIHGMVASVFGAADAIDSARLTIDGPGARSVEQVDPATRRLHAHTPDSFPPAEPIWVWHHGADGVQGAFTLRLEAHNRQGTHSATSSALFEVGSGWTRICQSDGECAVEGGQQIPGVPWVWSVAALGALAIRRRRG